MNNKIANGKVLDVVAPAGGFTGGTPAVVGAIVGIPTNTVAEGEVSAVDVCGVFEVPKEAAADIAQGDACYWDAADGEVNTDNANPLMGHAYVAAGNGVETIQVRLTTT